MEAGFGDIAVNSVFQRKQMNKYNKYAHIRHLGLPSKEDLEE